MSRASPFRAGRVGKPASPILECTFMGRHPIQEVGSLAYLVHATV